MKVQVDVDVAMVMVGQVPPVFKDFTITTMKAAHLELREEM